ncbi:hypothetical protein F4801DRAFT_545513, partial [Xylaria longipes]
MLRDFSDLKEHTRQLKPLGKRLNTTYYSAKSTCRDAVLLATSNSLLQFGNSYNFFASRKRTYV